MIVIVCGEDKVIANGKLLGIFSDMKVEIIDRTDDEMHQIQSIVNRVDRARLSEQLEELAKSMEKPVTYYPPVQLFDEPVRPERGLKANDKSYTSSTNNLCNNIRSNLRNSVLRSRVMHPRRGHE